MGLSKCHGLRQAYAQRRYHELTGGLLCPIESGMPVRLLSKEDRAKDRKARDLITRELGHSRRAILKIYVG